MVICSDMLYASILKEIFYDRLFAEYVLRFERKKKQLIFLYVNLFAFFYAGFSFYPTMAL